MAAKSKRGFLVESRKGRRGREKLTESKTGNNLSAKSIAFSKKIGSLLDK